MALLKYSVKLVLQQTAEPSKSTSLRCFIRYNNTRSVFASGIYIEPRYWNVKAQEPRQSVAFKDHAKVLANVKDIRKSVELAFEHYAQMGGYPAPEELKATVQGIWANGGKLPGSKNKVDDLFTYIDQVISDTKEGCRLKPNGARYAPSSALTYETTYTVLKRFAKHRGVSTFKFNEITLGFYFDLKEFALGVEKLSDNYFGSVVKFVKTCMAEAKTEKLHTNDEFSSKRFSVVQVDVDNIYLNEQQLDKLFKHDFGGNKRLERARDLFLLGCWTGLRFSDFTNIKASNFQNDNIVIKQQKTGSDTVVPVHDTVKAVMKRYAGITPNSLPPSISNVSLNTYIREAAKDAGLTETVQVEKVKGGVRFTTSQPLYQLVSSHTARRSFATNMFKRGMSANLVMGVTGHKTEKAFMKYIKATPTEKADMMREVWNRQAMKAVEG